METKEPVIKNKERIYVSAIVHPLCVFTDADAAFCYNLNSRQNAEYFVYNN